MGIVDGVKTWLLGKALAKAMKALAAVVVSYVTSVKVAGILAQMGVTIDVKQLAEGLTLLGTAAITILLNFLKVKFGLKFL